MTNNKVNITLVVDDSGLLVVYSDCSVKVRLVNQSTHSVVQVDEDRIMTETQQFEEVKTLIK